MLIKDRQCAFQRSPRRTAARFIAVKTTHHLICVSVQLFEVRFTGGRTERGYRIGDAVLRQRHNIHVAFYYQQRVNFAQRFARLV